MVREDLTGRTFGLLTVLGPASDEISPNGARQPRWRCCCECGAEVITRGSSLKSGHTKGCGQKHRRVEDLTGQTFGKLTVLERAPDHLNKDGTKYIMWKCRCECGNEVVTRATSLKNGHTRSCGCAHHDGAMGIGLEDITGQKFGRWTVLYENGRLKEPRGRLVPLWHCRCECGTERDLRAGTLKSGSSLSCGCYKAEILSEKAACGFGLSSGEKMVNQYLQSIGVYYEPQKVFPDLVGKKGYPLSYDFLVYMDGEPFLLIEYQSAQHYRPVDYFGGEAQFVVQQENDNKKRKYALHMKLALVEIPYTCNTYESIVQLLSPYFEDKGLSGYECP